MQCPSRVMWGNLKLCTVFNLSCAGAADRRILHLYFTINYKQLQTVDLACFCLAKFGRVNIPLFVFGWNQKKAWKS
jgi:hypothetical protein